MSRRLITIAFGIIGIILIGALGYLAYRYFAGGSGTITVWTLSGTEEAVKKVASIYAKKYPAYRVKIVPVPEQAYEFKALYSLASQSDTANLPAPDVWILPNEWLPLHRNKLVAAPDGSLNRGLTAYAAERPDDATPPPAPQSGRSNAQIIEGDYAPIAKQDLMHDGQVWGVPLNLDTLALLYDRTKISPAPKTWQEVADAARRFTLKSGDTITRSSVALGDATSVSHAVDILSILMLQSGTDMVDTATQTAVFNITETGSTPPGTRALDYYTSFARPNRETYSWQSSLGNSITALKDGKTFMAMGYLSDLSALGGSEQSRIAVAPLPQTDPNKPQTYGRYLAATVTKSAERPEAAWNFVSLFANPDVSELYATTLRTIPARTDVAKRVNYGAGYQPFLDQVGQATNWQKREAGQAERVLSDAINLVVQKNENAQVALDVAAKAYTTFLQAPTGIETDPAIVSMWQSTEDPTDYRSIVQGFLRDKPELKRIAISQHTPERMEWETLNAMAARLGPDILLLPNDSVARYAATIRAFPNGSLNFSNNRADDLLAYERVFAPAVVTDNVVDRKIYGVPAHLETLMLAYNVDLFRQLAREKAQAGDADYYNNQDTFISGPVTWDDLKTMSRIATVRSEANLERAFVALGTGSNVAHAEDILAVLVKQFGGELTDPDRNVTGIHLPFSVENTTVAGEQALTLVKSFADPAQPHYTWRAGLPNSIEALADGKVMMAFVYPRDIQTVMKRSPLINLRYFPLPQQSITAEPVDFASYYTFTIPKASRKPNDALAFIHAALSTARNDIVNQMLLPPTLDGREIPVTDRVGRGDPQRIQRNTAQSYYKGFYPDAVDTTLRTLIDGGLNLDQAANRINQALAQDIP